MFSHVPTCCVAGLGHLCRALRWCWDAPLWSCCCFFFFFFFAPPPSRWTKNQKEIVCKHVLAQHFVVNCFFFFLICFLLVLVDFLLVFGEVCASALDADQWYRFNGAGTCEKGRGGLTANSATWSWAERVGGEDKDGWKWNRWGRNGRTFLVYIFFFTMICDLCILCLFLTRCELSLLIFFVWFHGFEGNVGAANRSFLP